MRWWLHIFSTLLLAGCTCPQPQQQYQRVQQRVPPSVHVAPPAMYSTVLRRNKSGKMVKVRVRTRPEPTAPVSAGGSEPPPPPDNEIWTATDPKVQSDLNDLSERVEDLRRRMSREPGIQDVRQ